MSNDLNDTLEDIAGTHLGDDDLAANKPLVRRSAPTPQQGWLEQEPDHVRGVLARRGENRNTLIRWINSNLKEGADYGVIKGRKSLWKPGAEKIAGMLGLQVNWPDLHEELARIRDTNPTTLFLSCELLRDGVVQAQGAGARSIADDDGNWNKAIKMCKKSAMIDAVLNVAGLSEVFTQDLDDDMDTATISEGAQDALLNLAIRLFDDKADQVLESLARRRFQFDDGDWRRIPSFRLADAMRSLEEKAGES